MQVGATEFVVDDDVLKGAEASRSSASSRAGDVGDALPKDRPIVFCVRPEALRVIGPGETTPERWATVEARIARVEFLGALTRVETQLADGTALRVALLDQPLATLAVGQPLRFAYDPRRLTCFGTP